jgi:DNA-binding HxlR family transcriptional regulator
LKYRRYIAMENCPVKYALNILGGKWKLPILWELSQQDVIRFNELQRRLQGISSFILSKSLTELEKDSLIIRTQYNEVPPHVEYSLTELGKDIRSALEMLAKWGVQARQINQISE